MPGLGLSPPPARSLGTGPTKNEDEGNHQHLQKPDLGKKGVVQAPGKGPFVSCFSGETRSREGNSPLG